MLKLVAVKIVQTMTQLMKRQSSLWVMMFIYLGKIFSNKVQAKRLECRQIDSDRVGETTSVCRRNDLDVGESTCRRNDLQAKRLTSVAICSHQSTGVHLICTKKKRMQNFFVKCFLGTQEKSSKHFSKQAKVS